MVIVRAKADIRRQGGTIGLVAHMAGQAAHTVDQQSIRKRVNCYACLGQFLGWRGNAVGFLDAQMRNIADTG